MYFHHFTGLLLSHSSWHAQRLPSHVSVKSYCMYLGKYRRGKKRFLWLLREVGHHHHNIPSRPIHQKEKQYVVHHNGVLGGFFYSALDSLSNHGCPTTISIAFDCLGESKIPSAWYPFLSQPKLWGLTNLLFIYVTFSLSRPWSCYA